VRVRWRARCARELVLATGPWSRDWARQLDLRVPIQPGKGYSLTWSRPAQVPSARWC
jgi:D-amino-acid dehydrogenase